PAWPWPKPAWCIARPNAWTCRSARRIATSPTRCFARASASRSCKARQSRWSSSNSARRVPTASARTHAPAATYTCRTSTTTAWPATRCIWSRPARRSIRAHGSSPEIHTSLKDSGDLLLPGAERVMQQTPGIRAAGHFLVGQQAIVQLTHQLREVDVLPDEHQPLAAVTDVGVPVLHYLTQAFLVLRPVLLGYEAPPAPGQAMTHQATGLRPAAGLLIFAGQPEETLGAQQATIAPFLREEIEEALRMERPPRAIGA